MANMQYKLSKWGGVWLIAAQLAVACPVVVVAATLSTAVTASSAPQPTIQTPVNAV